MTYDVWWAFCQRPENDGAPLHYDPANLGGATAWGVTWATYQDVAAGCGLVMTWEAFKVLTQDQASIIARKKYWDAIRADEMGPAGIIWADFHYTSGGANRCLQELLGVTADGVVGDETLAALGSLDDPLNRMTEARIAYYQSLNVPQDIRGWTRRANDTLVAAQAA